MMTHPYPDVMLDIETLGTRPGAPILSIAVVLFDANDQAKWLCNIRAVQRGVAP